MHMRSILPVETPSAWLVYAGLVLLSCHSSFAIEEGYARSADAFIQDAFRSKKSCMVIGFIDADGAKVLSAGKLDNGTDAKPDGDSLFFIGSVSKTFTALLLQTMVDHGEVKLDDPVANYLPTFVKVPAHNGRPITLFDLATQSSGLPADPGNMTGKDVRAQYESYSADQLYAYLTDLHLSRDPGSEFEYSNVGMSLLGHALWRKAGTTYESLIIDRICRPLHMGDTCIHPSPQQMSRLAMGHDESGNSSPPWNLNVYAPAGAIHSTANDLLKYAAAQAGLTTCEITASIEKTHVIRHIDTRGLPGLAGTGFGQTAMCWVDHGAFQPPGMQLLGHAGGAGSYHAWVGFDMKQHRGVVVLTTDNDLTVESIGWTLLQHKPLNAQSAKEFEHELVGIGAALDMNKQTHVLSMTKVFPNSPAADAGLTAGMTIHKIDNNPLDTRSLAECLQLLRGEAGTKVRLELHMADGSIKNVELIRKKFLVGQR